MGPREVELAAVGCFYLTEPRGENREVLPMLPTITSPEEFGEKLRWWLNHDDERARVARAARQAIADRTFDNNCRFLLERLESQPSRRAG
jgi:spore maturation protein CgeB